MRRILAWMLASMVSGALLAGAALAPAPVLAQQQGDQPTTAAELVRLWERMPQIQDPAERIAESERALKLVDEVDPWPLPVTRDEARARLWRWSGLGHAQWTGGQREENLERAITAYERATQVFTREAAPREWARTQNALAEAHLNRIRGDRAENLEKAIALHEGALTILTREAFPEEWALTQAGLGDTRLARIRGDRADNLEEAIARYEAALTVLTREAAPEDWALTQARLGAAHLLRIRGDRAESLEKAIALYGAALTVLTREAFPHDWAVAQNDLGAAYSDRLRGDRADNQEKAIAALEAALTVRTREAMPRDWAATLHNLAGVYSNRLRGNQAGNQEKAIELYEAALTVRTRETGPQDWALTRHALGNVYRGRALGDRAENVEKSIEQLEAALAVRNPTEQQKEWADAKHDLGLAFILRARGERADNMEKAIGAFEDALTVLSPKHSPQAWAQAKSLLALVHTYRIHGRADENREKAILHLQDALQVLTRDAYPQPWAEAQLSLGLAHQRRGGGQGKDLEHAIQHLEAALTVMTRETNPRGWAAATMALGNARSQRAGADPAAAIGAYEAALTVYNREEFPLEWSLAQTGLGAAYFESAQGDRPVALAKAISHLEAAMSVLPQSSPRDSLHALRMLGAALSEKGEWRQASAAYAHARQVFRQLLAQGLDDTAAGAVIGEAGPLFAEAAYAAVQLGEIETALELANEGRARLMAAALKLQTLDLAADKRQRLDALRFTIRAAERTMEAPTTQGAERAAAVERLLALRQELMGLVKEADAAETTARGSALGQARALAGKAGAVAVPIVTRLGGKILIVKSGADAAGPGRKPKGLTPRGQEPAGGASGAGPQGLTAVHLPELTTAALNTFMYGTGPNDGWIFAYSVNLLPDDLIDEGWPIWMSGIDRLGPDLWRLIGSRLDAALKEAGVKRGARLVWLPTGGLGIMPLGIAQDPAGKRRLADAYEIVYAPSLDALASVQGRTAKPAPATLAAIVNPTGDLPAAEQEGKAVTSHFPAQTRTVLEGSEATPEAVLAALKGRSYWHFASHGSFVWRDARQSALVMTGHQRLSVGRLLDAGDLGRPRLVVLSACETGLFDINSNPDEFIGLPGTFTALGAAGVLGTLWPVNDMATALLVSKFYDLHLMARLAPPAALRQAQLWLRQATNADLVSYAKGAARQGRLGAKQVAAIEEELTADNLRRARNRALVEWIGPAAPAGARKPASPGLARPYAHPYYWAGFIYTGL